MEALLSHTSSKPPLASSANPLASYSVHQHIDNIAVIGRLNESGGGGGGGGAVPVDLSLRPSRVKLCSQALIFNPPPSLSAADIKKASSSSIFDFPTITGLSVGSKVTGVTQQVAENHLWVALSPSLRAKVSALDAAAGLLPILLASSQAGNKSKSGTGVVFSRDILDKFTNLQRCGFYTGQVVSGTILSISTKSRQIDLALNVPLPSQEGAAAAAAIGADVRTTRSRGRKGAEVNVHDAAAVVGSSGLMKIEGHEMVLGCVVSISGSGVMVQVSSFSSSSSSSTLESNGKPLLGLISTTDLHDVWVDNSISGIKKGALVLARVLAHPPAANKNDAGGDAAEGSKVRARDLIKLSARPAHGGWISKVVQGSLIKAEGEDAADHGAVGSKKSGAKKRPAVDPTSSSYPASSLSSAPEAIDLSSLAPGASLTGYVKASGPKGVFVCLDRSQDARIKIKNLSDGFVEDPVNSFPPGSRVQGRVLSLTSQGMIDMTLRTAMDPAKAQSSVIQLSDLHVGQASKGSLSLSISSCSSPLTPIHGYCNCPVCAERIAFSLHLSLFLDDDCN